MVQMTIQVPDDLSKRLQPIAQWIPILLELSLVGFKTQATEAATELIEFLKSNPSPEEVFNFQASDQTQTRLRQLLQLSKKGNLGQREQLEISELEKIEHIMIKLKARMAK